MNKKLLLFASALALAGTTMIGVRAVSAQSDEAPSTTLVKKIAERFGLAESDVQVVVDEVREEHHAEMLKKHEERLQDAVDAGTITADQKQLILDKHKEMEATRHSFADMTPDERHEAIRARHEELTSWAEENGIDMENLMMKFGSGRMHGKGFMKMNSEAN